MVAEQVLDIQRLKLMLKKILMPLTRRDGTGVKCEGFEWSGRVTRNWSPRGGRSVATFRIGSTTCGCQA
jgi:hypothetical protein